MKEKLNATTKARRGIYSSSHKAADDIFCRKSRTRRDEV
jgi:hypothetical protein